MEKKTSGGKKRVMLSTIFYRVIWGFLSEETREKRGASREGTIVQEYPARREKKA